MSAVLLEEEPVLTIEQVPHFEKGLDAIFDRWTAINLAIEHQMLGETTKEDFDDLKEKLKKWVGQDGDVVKANEVQQYIEDVILEDLGLEVQDGSIAEVSVAIMKLYGECVRNDFTGVQRLIELANKQTQHGVSRSYKQKYQNKNETTKTEEQNHEHHHDEHCGCDHDHDHDHSHDKMDDAEDGDDGWTTVRRNKH
jgi:hypothetical protein